MLFDYETLKLVWWVLIGVLLIGFALTSGTDMAVSVLSLRAGRSEDERGAILSTISPHWDGNQVWLITAGGAIFAAWPEIYSAAFSGLYWAMLLLLFAIWLRPLAFDYRSHIQTQRWQKGWDIALFVGSLVPMLICGVAFGNLLEGLPFWQDAELRWHYEGSFLTALLPLLNPFALLCGLVSICMLLTQGALWISLRTVDPIASRAASWAPRFAIATLVLFGICGIWAWNFDALALVSRAPEGSFNLITAKTVEVVPHGLYANYLSHPITMAAPILAVLGMLAGAWHAKKGRMGRALAENAVGIACIIATPAVALFPFLMPSTKDPASSLTLWDATSSQLTLTVMMFAVLIFVPLALGYTIFAYRRMWRRAAPGENTAE
jgi:cytochrome d ubiquinol oxidase subunit II